MAMDPRIANVQAQIDANPRIQAWLRNQQGLQARMSPEQRARTKTNTWAQLLEDEGIERPHDYDLNVNTGQLERDSFLERNPWVSGTLAAGGVLAGGAGLAALGAGTGVASGAATTGAWTAGGVLPSTAAGFAGTGFASAVPAVGAGAAAAGGGTVAGGGVLSSLLANPDTYATVAGLLGAAGKGAAAERGSENAYNTSADRARADIFGTQQSASTHAADAEEAAKLSRAQLGISAPNARVRQSILGSLLQNIQPVSVNVPDRVRQSLVSYEGGLSPALLNDLARQSGTELQRQAHTALLDKSDVPPMTDFRSTLLPTPQVTPYQQPGGFESGASTAATTAGTIGPLIAALMARRNGGQTAPGGG